MFDNYPPGVNPNANQPVGPANAQPVDMYAGLGNAQVNNQAVLRAPVGTQNQYNTMPNVANQAYPPVSNGSFKFLIIGLVTLVLVLAGAFAAYQMVLKPKFENTTPIVTDDSVVTDDIVNTPTDDIVTTDTKATSSTDTQIIYEPAVVTPTSTTTADNNPVTEIVTSTPKIIKQPEDIDSDKDGLNDDLELLKGTTKNNPDTDNDGLKDGEEVLIYFTDPLKADSDGDGLTDGDEVFKYKTKPLVVDTDADGYSDGQEVKNGYNPLGQGRLVLSN